MVSFFFFASGKSLLVLGTSLEIVGFISFLGLGGNGLFGLKGAFIFSWSVILFFKGFLLLAWVDSWGLTKVWFGFKGTFKLDWESF